MSRGGADAFLTTSATAYQKHVLHGQETVSIFIANFHAIFNDTLCKILTIFHAKTTGLSFIADVVRHYDSESVCHGRVLKFSQTDAIDSI